MDQTLIKHDGLHRVGNRLNEVVGTNACASGPAVTSAMSDEEELLVRCIAIRAAYGGMVGDVTMLREFAVVWSTRSATTATVQGNVRTVCATHAGRFCCIAVTWQAHMMCSHECQDLFHLQTFPWLA